MHGFMGSREQRIPGASNISRKNQTGFFQFQFDKAGAKDVSIQLKSCSNSGKKLYPYSGFHRLKPADCQTRLPYPIQRQGGGMGTESLLVGPRRIFFLNLPAVPEDNGTDGQGRGCSQYFPLKSFLYKARKVSRMVKMAMGKKYQIDLFRGKGNRLPVQFPKLLQALEKATVDKNITCWGFQ